METNIRKQNMQRAMAAVVIKVREGIKSAESRVKQFEAKRIELVSQMNGDLSDEDREGLQKEHYLLQEKINLQQEIIAEGQKGLIENGLQTEEDLKSNY